VCVRFGWVRGGGDVGVFSVLHTLTYTPPMITRAPINVRGRSAKPSNVV